MTLRTKKDVSTSIIGSEQDAGDDDRDPGGTGTTSVQRTTQRIPLPNNSLFAMGLETNARWMHSVHTDKRPENTKDPAERGPRISLTFRHIGTFLTPLSHSFSSPAGQGQEQEQEQQQFIFGQGATGKTRAEARPVVHGGEAAERLLAAFGAENHQSEFDWERAYGEGFDVLHFTTNTPVSAR
jgi:2-oxoglutarate-Fe(II)-dependent oxygenase superfamily protein